MMAHELDAYDLVDRATLKQFSRRFALPILVEGDARLLNEYAVTTLRPSGRGTLNERDAEAFASWIVSADARRLISGYRVEGERVFYLPQEARAR